MVSSFCLPPRLAQCSPSQWQALRVQAPLTALRSVLAGDGKHQSQTKGNVMKKAIVDIVISIENRTFTKIKTSDKDSFKNEANKRLHEMVGLLELARLLDLDERFIKVIEKHMHWLIKKRNAVH